MEEKPDSGRSEPAYRGTIHPATRGFGFFAVGVSLCFVLAAIIPILLYRYARPLAYAIERGDIEGVQKAIAKGKDVNAINRGSGLTMLGLAAKYGRYDRDLLLETPALRFQRIRRMLELLVDAGADINARGTNGRTVAFLVTYHPYFRHPARTATIREHKKLIAMLLNRGADFNLANKAGDTPLHNTVRASSGYGENLEIVELLVKSGVDINARNSESDSPLDLAIRGGQNNEITELLRRYGAKE